MKVLEKTGEGSIDLALDTIHQEKQGLVFVNAKRSAEKVAEDISKKLDSQEKLEILAEQVLKAIPKPTKQCERLATMITKGVAFHHAGLHYKQKEIIEDNFRNGNIKIIACTPTLAYGLDLPAFRAIIRDVKRFGPRGMAFIPVLEFLQICGRAGRPKYDKVGEAIVVSQTEAAKEDIFDRFVYGEPEEIYSKLAVEPVFRTYLLSLIAARFVKNKEDILKFFEKTFWAHQFADMNHIENIVDKMLDLLKKWEFIQTEREDIRATYLGKRVAEMYLDPLTAHSIIIGLKRWKGKSNPFGLLNLVSDTLEMYPQLRVTQKEYDKILEKVSFHEKDLLSPEPNMFEPEYDSWLNSFKTALMINDWINEADENALFETYNTRPGETRSKVDKADWLLYCTSELARINEQQDILKDIMKTRFRIKYGVKEELLPLLKLEGIGRVRARKLFQNGVKDLGGIRKAQMVTLTGILGKKIAESVKKQVGQDPQQKL